MAHFEKKLDSTTIYEGKILTLKRDRVELENGSITTREVVEHHGGVAVLALDENNQILFVSQFRYPFGEVLLELPAGKLEKGENPAECGVRELREECGCTAERFVPLAQMYPTCAYDTEIIHLYFASGLHVSDQHLDEDEFLTVERIPVEEAVKMVLDGKIPDAKTQLGILKYKTLHDKGLL
ncbi:NUDIX hydrolase [Oscillospiraceae bacterium PP1C4]